MRDKIQECKRFMIGFRFTLVWWDKKMVQVLLNQSLGIVNTETKANYFLHSDETAIDC